MAKVTKKMLREAYEMGQWNEYLYDLVYQEAVDAVQSNFDLDGDDNFDELQELAEAFIAGFHGDKFTPKKK